MNKMTTTAIFFLAAGILTSVTILSVYQILYAVPLIYYTVQAFKNKDYKLPKSTYWLLGFAAIALISLIINHDILPKPSRNFSRIKYFLFGACGIYVFRVWVKEATENTKKYLCTAFLATVIIAGIMAIYSSYYAIDERARGFTDTMRYGYGSAMLLLTLLSAILHQDKLKFFDVRLGIAAFVLGFLGMYVTYTRGALLGFLCGLPFVIYFFRAKYGLIVGGIATLLIAGFGLFYFYGTSSIGNNYGAVSRLFLNKNNSSDEIRRSQWEAAIIATKEKPILGWGLSNFHSQLKRIKHENDLPAKDYDDDHAHNLFLEIASGTGLVGLFVFLGWIISWAWEMFHKDQLTKALVIPFCVAWIVSSQFEVTFDANNAAMIFFLYPMSFMKKYV